MPLQESSELLAKLGETTIPADLPAGRRAAAEGSPAPKASGDQEDVTRKEDDNHAGGIVSAFWESLGEPGWGFGVQGPGLGLRALGVAVLVMLQPGPWAVGAWLRWSCSWSAT